MQKIIEGIEAEISRMESFGKQYTTVATYDVISLLTKIVTALQEESPATETQQTHGVDLEEITRKADECMVEGCHDEAVMLGGKGRFCLKHG